MKKEKKCLNCGSIKLKPAPYSIIDAMDLSLPIDIYVCEECGHIELFENKGNCPQYRW